MVLKKHKYQDFDIDIWATTSRVPGLWLGHYDIWLLSFGVASAALSGPHASEQDAADNALRTAKEFVDVIIGSRR